MAAAALLLEGLGRRISFGGLNFLFFLIAPFRFNRFHNHNLAPRL
jgi:hypothetical protein